MSANLSKCNFYWGNAKYLSQIIGNFNIIAYKEAYLNTNVTKDARLQ